jgi:hypothetical protein
MFKNLESVSISKRVGATMLAAPMIGHNVMFTLFSVYSFGTYFTVKIIFEGRGRGGKASYRSIVTKNC